MINMSAGAFARLFVIIAVFAASSISASPLLIRWEIGNRFRNFDFLKHSPGEKAVLNDRANDHNVSGSLAADWFSSLTSSSPTQNSTNPQEQIAWIEHVAETVGSPYIEGDNGAWDEASGAYSRDLVKLPTFMTVRASLVEHDSESEELNGSICHWMFRGREGASVQKPQEPFPCDSTEPILIDHIPTSGGILSVYSGSKELAQIVIPKPQLKIILGFGDSYSSGEGSPDYPTTWKGDVKHSPPEGNVGRIWDFDKYVARGAYWHSNRCDRSFYSWESQVALLLAKRDPHSIVSFVHLACAGAEVVDGMLFAQRNAPGQYRNCQRATKRRGHGLTVDLHCDVPSSQLTEAVRLLCTGATSGLGENGFPLRQWIDQLSSPNIQYAKDQLKRQSDLMQCQGEIRPTYLILMNMGGNDLGFAGLIANIVFPSKHTYWLGKLAVAFGRKSANAVCFNGSYCPDRGRGLTFERRADDLLTRYSVLQDAYQKLLKVKSSQVVIAQYPDPLIDERGGTCDDSNNGVDDRKDNQWSALKWLMPHSLPPPISGALFWDWTHRFEFNITQSEGDAAERNVIPKLNNKILNNKQGWIVASTADVFKDHGWCVGRWNKLYPEAYAASWDPFGMNDRYIRTADDSALTQWPPFSGDDSRDRLDGLSGTLHPNLQGYAAIANGVMGVLLNYDTSARQTSVPTVSSPAR